MSKHANKRTRRRRRQYDLPPHDYAHDGAWRTRHDDARLTTVDGVPVFDATVVDVVGDNDKRVLFGIGPTGCKPRAYVVLCPCGGVQEVVDELQRAGAIAAEHHYPHHQH